MDTIQIQSKLVSNKVYASIPRHLGFGNLLSQADGDQGDTAQRVGAYFALSAMANYNGAGGHTSLDWSYQLLQASPGIYRRSPKPDFWGANPNNLSRDQLSVLKIGMAASGQSMKHRLTAVAWAQLKRLGFHQNTRPGADTNRLKVPDIMTPGELSVYFRGLMGKYSVIPNSVLDAFFFVDLYLREDYNWDTDNMLALNLLYANYHYPTYFSKLAMSRYLKTNFMARLWNYHKDADGNNGCEPLYWLFRLAFLKRYNYEPTNAP